MKNLFFGCHSILFHPVAVQEKKSFDTHCAPSIKEHADIFYIDLSGIALGSSKIPPLSKQYSSLCLRSFLSIGTNWVLPQIISSRSVLIPSLWTLQGIWQLHSFTLTYIKPQEGYKCVKLCATHS